MEATYRIPEGNLDVLRTKLAEINKKAAKLSAAPLALAITPADVEEYFASDYHREMDIKSRRQWYTVVLTGETPKYEGWEFLATIFHTSEGNILSSIPGTGDLPEAYRTAEASCDHCQTVRRRNLTYVVRSMNALPDECIMYRVGSSCLADFLGGTDPHSIAKWAEYVGAFARSVSSLTGDEFGSSHRERDSWSLLGFLSITAMAIRLEGWVSKADARGSETKVATVSNVLSFLAGPWGGADERREWERQFRFWMAGPNDADKAIAAESMEWAANQTGDLNDYLWNLSVVARSGSVTGRTAGLAASIVSSHQRNLRWAAERKPIFASTPSQYIGKTGERLNIEVVVTEARVLPDSNGYGPSTLVKFGRGPDLLVWFASGDVTDQWVKGQTYVVRATVKRHEEKYGQKQTVIIRVTPAKAAK